MGLDAGHRGRGAGPGDLHADQDFRRAYEAFAAKREAGVRGQLMADRTFLDWPFFEDRHRALAERPRRLGEREPRRHRPRRHVDAACRRPGGAARRRRLAAATPPSTRRDHGSSTSARLCLIRETLARHDGLADFAFAMQGLGTGAISLFGTDEQKARWLPGVARGRDHRRLRPDRARGRLRRRRPRHQRRAATATAACSTASKTWISNGGIADLYTVFARTGEAPGAKGLSAFVVDADTPGLEHRRAHRRPSPRTRWRASASTHCRIPADRAARRARRRLHASPWRRSTSSARPSAPPPSASPAAPSTRPSPRAAAPQAVRRAARRPADGPGHARRHGARRSTPRRCSSTAPPGPRIAARRRVTREAAMAKLYATDARAVGHRRGRPAPRRPRRRQGRVRSRASTARSARCASTRAPPRCRRW